MRRKATLVLVREAYKRIAVVDEKVKKNMALQMFGAKLVARRTPGETDRATVGTSKVTSIEK